jgi:hypothetical protein
LIQVLVIPEVYDTGSPTACAYLRLVLPLTIRSSNSAIDIRFVSLERLHSLQGDVIIAQRVSVKTQADIDTILTYRARTGAKLIYDIDDDLLALGEDHPEKDSYAALVGIVRQMLLAADQTWVSTHVLAERYQHLSEKIVVLPNRLDPRIWKARRIEHCSDKPIRFIYAGTPSHQLDYEQLIAPSFQKLRLEFGRNVELQLIGLRKNSEAEGTFETTLPSGVAGSYPAFASWIQTISEIDIGLAPLVDTYFNRAKSNIKWLEYSALGVASILTDNEAYRGRNERSNLPAMLVEPSVDAFHDAMRHLVVDRRRTVELGEAAHRVVSSSLSDTSDNQHRHSLIESIVSE